MQTLLMSLFALTNYTATHTWESLEAYESAILLSVSSPFFRRLAVVQGRACIITIFPAALGILA